MVSCEPVIRWCMSSESAGGTMRSLSPLAMSVGWVIRRQVGGCGAPPAFDRFELGSEGRHADLRVPVLGAFLEAFDECAGGAFADVVAVEEQELLGVLSGEGGTQRVVIGCPGDFVDACYRLRVRSRSGSVCGPVRDV